MAVRIKPTPRIGIRKVSHVEATPVPVFEGLL